MGQWTINLSAEEEKALLTDMISVQEWLDNVIHDKARKCIDRVATQALEDSTDKILTKAEKQQVVSALAAQGKIITTVKQIPEIIKYQIVAKARVKSAAKRNAEVERE